MQMKSQRIQRSHSCLQVADDDDDDEDEGDDD
jgi:hypothetical protein